ncbi:MAG: hypothetical protein MRY64_06805 [Hyphomonadaceae bacterium]|nr:hypothetical protein [Hyphomonadaceae bacterium]
MKLVSGAIAGALMMTACGGGGGSSASRGANEMAEACEAELNVPTEVCACIGETAERELSARQIDFLLAAMEEDGVTTARLRAEMGIAEATEAGMFLVNAPADCARSTAQ